MSQVQVKTRADIFAAPSDVSESPLSAAAAAAVIGVVQEAGFAGEGGVTLPATTSAVGTVRLADSAAITAGTAGRVVDAAQLKAAVGGGGGSVTVNNTLTSTSTTEALSAAMGKALKDGLDAVAGGGGGGASIPVLRAIDTAGRTLVAADLSNLVRYNSASNANFTIPTDATLGIIDANSNVSIELYQLGTGRLDIVADTANGVTLNKWVGYPTPTQFVSQTIHRVAPNTWAVK